VDVYNPLSVRSGLYESLQFQLMKTAPARRKAAAAAAAAAAQVHFSL